MTTQALERRPPSGGAALNAAKTHCKYGHELSGANVRITRRRGRECIECIKRQRLAYRARVKSDPTRCKPDILAHATEHNMQNYMPVTESGCWLWLGGCTKKGYGYAYTLIRGACKAHRLFYTYYKGPIPDGLFLCHKCDTPLCVNPDHMFVGTARDNINDMYRKGRGYGFGKMHLKAALRATHVDAAAIDRAMEAHADEMERQNEAESLPLMDRLRECMRAALTAALQPEPRGTAHGREG